jgi:hypothetical protein
LLVNQLSEDPPIGDHGFLSGGGEMGARMRAIDWSKTVLGPVAAWPASLRTCVRVVLTSRQPMFVWWGERLINLYNDAYKTILGGKHPAALGQPAPVVWHEIWDVVEPRAMSALRGHEGTYDEALLLIMERNGYPEETYYTFSYSPVPNDHGGTGGVFCANTEDTGRIMGERQLALLRELASRGAVARTRDAACAHFVEALASSARDLPFAAIYLIDAERTALSLSGVSGIRRGHAAVPERLTVDTETPWPVRQVLESSETRVVSRFDDAFGQLPTGGWEDPPKSIALVPITTAGDPTCRGILVVGLNPFRLFGDDYSSWRARSAPASPAWTPTRKSGAASRLWPSSIARRRRSSAT